VTQRRRILLFILSIVLIVRNMPGTQGMMRTIIRKEQFKVN